MSGRRRRTWPPLALALGALASPASPPPVHHVPLEIVQVAGSPIRILPRGTRVANTLDRDPWAALRGRTRTDDDRAYGPGEYQLSFDVAFVNASERQAVAVVFLWEAFDEDRRPVYRRIGTFASETIPAGTARTRHEVALDPAPGARSYRVSVYRVGFADGTSWSPPEPDPPEAP